MPWIRWLGSIPISGWRRRLFRGLHRTLSDPTGARQLLAQVFATGRDPATDPFIHAYAGEPFHVKVQVAPGVVAELPIGREAVGLVLAGLHHRAGDVDAAIAVLQQLPPDSHVRVDLADLYAAAGRDGNVVRVTDGITNTDEVGALLCLLRGVALRHVSRSRRPPARADLRYETRLFAGLAHHRNAAEPQISS